MEDFDYCVSGGPLERDQIAYLRHCHPVGLCILSASRCVHEWPIPQFPRDIDLKLPIERHRLVRVSPPQHSELCPTCQLFITRLLLHRNPHDFPSCMTWLRSPSIDDFMDHGPRRSHRPRQTTLADHVAQSLWTGPTMDSLVSKSTSVVTSLAPTLSAKRSLDPKPGAPLSADPSLVPSKYLAEKSDADDTKAKTSSIGVHLPSTRPHVLLRAPPSGLLDAPARAALSMPNAVTSHGQARAVRGSEAKTPEYEINGDELLNGNGGPSREENTPLLSPNPSRPGGLSRSSSTASISSARGILRRVFIDRANTPSQHLARPTFPPPSSSTYSPLPPSPLSFRAKINLFINQAISVIISTFFLAFVVLWATAAELMRALPKWLRPIKAKKFPWDDERYWRKEGRKVSKDPKDYARQVGMDIEHQTVETEDGYFLRLVTHLCGVNLDLADHVKACTG